MQNGVHLSPHVARTSELFRHLGLQSPLFWPAHDAYGHQVALLQGVQAARQRDGLRQAPILRLQVHALSGPAQRADHRLIGPPHDAHDDRRVAALRRRPHRVPVHRAAQRFLGRAPFAAVLRDQIRAAALTFLHAADLIAHRLGRGEQALARIGEQAIPRERKEQLLRDPLGNAGARGHIRRAYGPADVAHSLRDALLQRRIAQARLRDLHPLLPFLFFLRPFWGHAPPAVHLFSHGNPPSGGFCPPILPQPGPKRPNGAQALLRPAPSYVWQDQ